MGLVSTENGEVMSLFEDRYGKPINIGDTIAMAFSKSSSAEIRVGEVIEFVQSKPKPYSTHVVDKMRVRWLAKSSTTPKRSLVENSHSCVVLEHGYEL
jgi:hypothetical protein